LTRFTVKTDPGVNPLKLVYVIKVDEVVHGDGEHDPTLPWNEVGKLTTKAEFEFNACEIVMDIM